MLKCWNLIKLFREVSEAFEQNISQAERTRTALEQAVIIKKRTPEGGSPFRDASGNPRRRETDLATR